MLGVFEFDEVVWLWDMGVLIVGKVGVGLFVDGFCGVFGEFDCEVGSYVSFVGLIEESGCCDFCIVVL